MNPNQQHQLASSSDLSAVLGTMAAPRMSAPIDATLEAWIEGSPALIAEFDSGVQTYGLKRVYWREHKVGWRRIRLVYKVSGEASRMVAFKKALDDWVAALS